MSETGSSIQASRQEQWRRGIRPLVWWLVFVLVLLAYHTHKRLLEQTRLTFSASLEGRDNLFMDPATATFDLRGIRSGQRIPLGWHTFTVSHPRGIRFTTNLFVWYGPHDFGQISLKRAKGRLEIHASPPALTLTITGPEFRVTLTNSAGITTSVPTDNYWVEAIYRHWQQAREVSVSTYVPSTYSIEGPFGAVQLTCNQSNASFQLLKENGELLETGEFPSTIRDVPAGAYKLVALHHRNQREQWLSVKTGITNAADTQFLYGAAVLETYPAEAVVTSADGREWGYTPLVLPELPVGHWQFKLLRSGYTPASVALEILPEQTNSFSTNLVSANYTGQLNSARRFLAAGNYQEAEVAATTALQARPNDPDALAVQNEASGKSILNLAKTMGKQGDYTTGIKEVGSALKVIPDSEEAKELLAEFKRREPEQIERERQKRLNKPKAAFETMTREFKDADLFEQHELKTGKAVMEVRTAIANALLDIQPHFALKWEPYFVPETFLLEATQNVPGGQRHCLIAGAQTRDDETVILFKVLEYKNHHDFGIDGNLNFKIATERIPIHPSRIPDLTDKLKLQVEEGQRIVTERIQRGIQ